VGIFISYFNESSSFALIENVYLPRNIHNPIAMKARVAPFLRIFWGMEITKIVLEIYTCLPL
jgi:hypothetical protein